MPPQAAAGEDQGPADLAGVVPRQGHRHAQPTPAAELFQGGGQGAAFEAEVPDCLAAEESRQLGHGRQGEPLGRGVAGER